MRKITLVFIAIIFSMNGYSQNWLWARQAAAIGSQEGVSSAVDAFGNVFATGLFYSPSVTFDSITLTNAGQYDIFLVKYSSSGSVLWARGVGGNFNDQGWSVATDILGNAYITGYFNSPALIFGTDTLTNASVWKMFVVKYDSSGNVLWARSGEGGSSVKGNSITTSSAGNVLVTGDFYGTDSLIFGLDTLRNTSSSSSSIFLVEYSSTGTVVWAKGAEANGNGHAASVAIDPSENIFVTGYFSGTTITFDTVTLLNTDTTGLSDDIFIAKYSSTGSLIWARKSLGTDVERAAAVAIDNLGNAYVTGFFNDPQVVFGSDTLSGAGGCDMFVVKYSASGTVLFAESAGGINNEMGWSVATDASGVYVAGGFLSPSVVFDSDTLNFLAGAADPMFMVKYDFNLHVICANAIASGGDDWCGLSTDVLGNTYVAGDIYGTIPIIIGTDTLSTTTSLQELFFIAKYRCESLENVNQLSKESESILFPNPATSQISITNNQSSIKEIEIFSSLGEKVFSQISNLTSHISVDVSQLPPGIYFITVTDQAGNKVTKKVVKL